MPGTGERAYAYAKACGIIGKSFIDKRARALSKENRVSGLDRLIFPDSSRNLPEKELVRDFEKRINKRYLDAMLAIVNSFKKPPDFLSLLIRSWEYEDLKNAINIFANYNSHQHHNQEIEKIDFSDLGRFGTIDFSAWPDIKKMLKNTKFEYLLKILEKSNFQIQEELDKHYYNSLWQALLKLAKKDRKVSVKILSEEIALRNCVAALRLRTYYQLGRQEIRSHFIDINAQDAIASLVFPLNDRERWTGWKREGFLNPMQGYNALSGRQEPESNMPWSADPRYFQNKAALYIYKMARKAFHFCLSSLDQIFCFYKIKQFEEELILSHVEGVSTGLSPEEVISFMGMETL